jgi:hypothetical protein
MRRRWRCVTPAMIAASIYGVVALAPAQLSRSFAVGAQAVGNVAGDRCAGRLGGVGRQGEDRGASGRFGHAIKAWDQVEVDVAHGLSEKGSVDTVRAGYMGTDREEAICCDWVGCEDKRF